ncbi:MAG: transposase, partial [Chloroflexota bacterium]
SIKPPLSEHDAAPSDDLPRFNGHRIESARLSGWDYTANACYFVTICTRERLPFLGDVIDGRVILSEAGRIVDEEWRRTADVRPDVAIDEYVVMPNHVHGIIVLNRAPSNTIVTTEKTPHRGVSTARLAPGSLGAIVGQFKSVCTKRIRDAGMTDFGWQVRFYDHIIRDEESLNRIRQYIVDNPLKWELEQETPENLWM